MTSTLPSAAKATTVQLLCFEVDDQPYALDALCVREIRRWSTPTTLPDAPRHVRGVINLRGSIVPIYDLKDRFGQGESVIGPYHVLLIVEAQGRLAGFLADRVLDLTEKLRSDLQPLHETRRDEDLFVEAMVVVEDRVHAVLTVERILDVAQDDDAA